VIPDNVEDETVLNLKFVFVTKDSMIVGDFLAATIQINKSEFMLQNSFAYNDRNE